MIRVYSNLLSWNRIVK